MSFKKKGNYIVIPFTITSRKDLSDKAKLVFGIVQGYWEGSFGASNAWIAKQLGCSEKTIQRAVQELKKKGIVICTLRYDDAGRVKGRIIKIKKNEKTN